MTDLESAVAAASHILSEAGVPDARLEAHHLARCLFELSSSQVYSQSDRMLSASELSALRRATVRRASREPLAYIVKSQPFLGRDFYVDSHVLIPRPETELLVEKAIEFAISHQCASAADVGTGSGIIAVSLALASPELLVFATDVSTSSLSIARTNCIRYNVPNRVRLLQGNLLAPLPGPVDLVVANPPYVADIEMTGLSAEVGYEPPLALRGGADGTDVIAAFLRGLPGSLRDGGAAFLEIGYSQLKGVLQLVEQSLPGCETVVFKDPAGYDRVLKLAPRDFVHNKEEVVS